MLRASEVSLFLLAGDGTHIHGTWFQIPCPPVGIPSKYFSLPTAVFCCVAFLLSVGVESCSPSTSPITESLPYMKKSPMLEDGAL